MIPTPAKRLSHGPKSAAATTICNQVDHHSRSNLNMKHQQEEEEEEAKKEEEKQVLEEDNEETVDEDQYRDGQQHQHQHGLAIPGQNEIGMEMETMADEEEDEDYMRLDTIVEEDEFVCADDEDAAAGQPSETTTNNGCDRGGEQLRHNNNNHQNRNNRLTPAEIADKRRPTPPSLRLNPANNGIGNGSSNNSNNNNNNNNSSNSNSNSYNNTNVNTSLRKFTTLGGYGGDGSGGESPVLMMMNQPSNKKMQPNQELQNKTTGNSSNNNNNNSLNSTPLPSTNRLISEHQVRQQQALFRALAERQKLMDELDPSERVDLMSAAALNLGARVGDRLSAAAAERRRRHQQRQRRRRSQHHHHHQEQVDDQDEDAVLLSAVDLSSMSDRMLDELLGQLASASSSSSSSSASSLSSNCESLDSSDMSGAEADSNSSCASRSSSIDELNAAGSSSTRRRRHQAHEKPHQHQHRNRRNRLDNNNAPNVIGVHEDERTRANQVRINCRDAHRRARTNGHDHDDSNNDEDDSNNDHELVVHLNDSSDQQPNSNGSQHLFEADLSGRDSLSSPSSARAIGQQQQQRRRIDTTDGPSRLEEYFTSGLVNGHEFSATGGAGATALQTTDEFCDSNNDSPSRGSKLNATNQGEQQQASTANQDEPTVEEVLAQMLEALQEIGTSNQEQLNELLERGFAHLEQLLNCSLNVGPSQQPGSQTAATGKQRSQQQQQPPHSKTVSPNLATLTLSKDSDYGSDTQSADCFSHQFSASAAAAAASKEQQPLASAATTAMPTSGSGGGGQQLRGGDSPSPISLAASSSSSSSAASSSFVPQKPAVKQQQQQQHEPAGLSPLAIELSFKLAESLHKLAQQQQQQRQPNWPSAKQDPPRPPSAKLKTGTKSPMKSIVMINSPARSASSVVSSSSSPAPPLETDHLASPSPSCSPSSSSLAHQGNPTPASVASKGDDSPAPTPTPLVLPISNHDQQQQQPMTTTTTTIASNSQQAATKRQQFKTCLDISASGQVRVVSPVAGDSLPTDQQQQQQFVRRRSGRSSLRRRPSFSGSSAGSVRPGSPVPRSSLAPAPSAAAAAGMQMQMQFATPAPENSEPTTMMMMRVSSSSAASSSSGGLKSKQAIEKEQQHEREEQEHSNSKQQQQQKEAKQLQRVLIMAQKYNYSPAKLAASKLNSKLQLKDLAAAAAADLQGQTCKQQQLASGILPASSSISAQTAFQQQPAATTSKNRMVAGSSPAAAAATTTTTTAAVRVTGQVQLDISYFAKSGSLTVHVIQCSQLAPVSKRRATSNPYVKLYLLPDKSKLGKRKSAVHKSELNPQFNERFTFAPIQLAQFDGRILWLSVWHRDRLGRNDFLGEILLPLSQVRQQLLQSDLCQSTGAQWFKLSDKLNSLQPSPLASGGIHSISSNSNQLLPGRQHHQQHRIGKASSGSSGSSGRVSRNDSSSHGGRQVELADKLGELQRKAALLTTAAVAPPGGVQLNHQGGGMNVSLGPMPADSSQVGGSPITGKLFVALKFVPDSSGSSSGSDDDHHNHHRNHRQQHNHNQQHQLQGQLHVNIKEAHNIAGFENHSPAAVMAAANSNQPAANGSLPLGSSSQNSGEQQPQWKPPPSGSLPNPFCKCYLLASNGQRVAKFKTPHLKRTSQPRWDFKCVFNQVKLPTLASQAIEILMFNRDSILVSNNEFLGGIRLCHGGGGGSSSSNNDHSSPSKPLMSTTTRGDCSSNDPNQQSSLCSERESRLWSQMLARPNIWVYGELELRQLRPLLPAATCISATTTKTSNSANATNSATKTTTTTTTTTSATLTRIGSSSSSAAAAAATS